MLETPTYVTICAECYSIKQEQNKGTNLKGFLIYLNKQHHKKLKTHELLPYSVSMILN